MEMQDAKGRWTIVPFSMPNVRPFLEDDSATSSTGIHPEVDQNVEQNGSADIIAELQAVQVDDTLGTGSEKFSTDDERTVNVFQTKLRVV